MRSTLKVLSTGIAIALLETPGARGQAANYVLDNGSISTPLDASDTTEPRDDWFANEFTAQAGANLITRVDFYSFTTTPGSQADVVLYQVTGAGGNPALGATRVYTQAFTPPTGDGTNSYLTQIKLTGPVAFTVGSEFLVAVFIPDVIALPPYDVYPYLLDTSASATGSYWDRSTPKAFNLDNISGAMPVNQNLAGGAWNPGAGHLFIRAYGNGPPVLAPIPDQALYSGQTLTLTASATDINSPPLTLTFSLGSGAPPGAAINPSTGRFAWTPANAPSTNLVTIIVADNGVPSLSATQSFLVTVLPPPLQSVSLSGNRFSLSWLALSNCPYQVEYKGSLTDANWTPLGPPLTGAGGPLSTSDSLTSTQRFYRLRVIQ